MQNKLIFFFRLVVWLILVILEAVIGFPWLSLWLGGEWVMGFSPNTEIISLIILAVLLASVYAVPLTVSGLAMIIIWLARRKFRRNSWLYLAYLIGGVILIGIASGTKISWLTSLSTIISWLIFLKISGISLTKKLWQKSNSAHLGKRIRHSGAINRKE
ncbi:MAG: hypothetical protein ABII10_01530 [Candidatus Paceibacterota bacterium]